MVWYLCLSWLKYFESSICLIKVDAGRKNCGFFLSNHEAEWPVNPAPFPNKGKATLPRLMQLQNVYKSIYVNVGEI